MHDLQFSEMFVVIYNDIGEGSKDVAAVCRCQSHGIGAAGPQTLQAIDAVLKANTVARLQTEGVGGTDITVGIGLRTLEIFSRKDMVEELVYLGMMAVDILHLRLIAARDDGRGDALLMKAFHELLKTGDIRIVHLSLIIVEARRDLLLQFLIAGEIAVVDLREGLSLDLMGKVRQLRFQFLANLSPENRVLRLCIKNDPIEIE